MAGDWIPLRLALPDDPAVIAIAAALGVDEDLVVGKLHRFWSWANLQTEDGNALGVTEAWIDRHVRMAGFARQLSSVGWLSIEPTGVRIPRFEKYNGQSGKRRAKTNERVAAHRERKRLCNADSVTESVTREEKKIEEGDKSAAHSSPASASPNAEDDSPVILIFPTVGRGPSQWQLRQSLVAELSAAYPDVDVVEQAKRALIWVKAKHRKTAKGMPAFLNTWMTRATNDGPTRAARNGLRVPALSTFAPNGRPDL